MPPRPPLPWRGALPPSFLLPGVPLSGLCTRRPSTLPTSGPRTGVRTFKSKHTPRLSRFSHDPNRAPLGATSTAALARKLRSTPMRAGALAVKRGMTGVYDAGSGRRDACTVLQLDRNQVVAHKTRAVHGYYAVQVGAGAKEPRNVSRPLLGHFAAARVAPKRWLAEFKVRGPDALRLAPVGAAIPPAWFRVGQMVNVRGTSKGKGFAGGMKKFGWSGQPASHGASLSHRSMGSSGGGQGSGSRVHPGKNMPGRLGGDNATVRNLLVLQVDDANGIVVVKGFTPTYYPLHRLTPTLPGCVPGPKDGMVTVQDTVDNRYPWRHPIEHLESKAAGENSQAAMQAT